MPVTIDLSSKIALVTMSTGGIGFDVANMALFLLSSMSSYVTGQVISVNGGVSVA